MKLVGVGRRTFSSFISSYGRPRPPSSSSRRFFSSLQQHEAEERGPFPDKLLRLADQIAGLSDPELSRMSTDLRRMLGLPEPSATIGPLPGFDGASLEAAAPAQEEEKAPEKTSFDLRIEKFEAASKIKVIKEVRAFTSLGLKEAKELVEKVPTVFKTGVEKEEALQIIEKLKLAGATVVME